MVKTASFASRFFRDYGNWPLLVANAAAIGLVAFFGGRKLFQHPDTFVERKDRDFGAVRTDERVESAENFRKTTGVLAGILDTMNKIGTPLTGRKIIDISTYGKDIPGAPIEHSGFFKDGLYENVEVYPVPVGEIIYNEPVTEEE